MHRTMKPAALLAVLFLSAAAVSAQTAFSGLDAAQKAALARGETVFRSLSSYKKLAIPAAAPGATELIAAMKDLGPNYLGETIMVVPRTAAGSDALSRLAAILIDVAGYKGIPYWSVANERFYDLFSKSEQVSRTDKPGAVSIEARHHMEPFDEYRAAYTVSTFPSRLYYTGENLTPLVYSYRDLKVLDPGRLRWVMSAWTEGDNYVFYGVGAARAFDLFGLFRDKMETSLVGRIKAFFGYAFGKMREAGS